MNEEEFDSLMKGRPFGTQDALRADAQMRRIFTLGAALWGRTPADLQRQLRASNPEIPQAISLTDLRELLRSVEAILTVFHDEKNALATPLSSPTITVGTQRFT